jgi:hypothetical protein
VVAQHVPQGLVLALAVRVHHVAAPGMEGILARDAGCGEHVVLAAGHGSQGMDGAGRVHQEGAGSEAAVVVQLAPHPLAQLAVQFLAHEPGDPHQFQRIDRNVGLAAAAGGAAPAAGQPAPIRLDGGGHALVGDVLDLQQQRQPGLPFFVVRETRAARLNLHPRAGSITASRFRLSQ